MAPKSGCSLTATDRMRHADKALEDDALLLIIQEELAKRCKKRKTRGRKATP